MRICILYDSLQPYRIGGAERLYFDLASSLAAEGHQVTYVTMRQWPKGERGTHPAAEVVAVGPYLANYKPNGARTLLPPLLFGWGVLLHLLRQGRRYDVVHTASFPYFSVLAAALVRPLGRYRLVVDWLEFWSFDYWRQYLGPLGWIGWWVQKLCLAVPQKAFCLARLTAERLLANGVNGSVEVLTGLYAGDMTARVPRPAEPLIIFAGRLIPEKRAPLVVAAAELARRQIPNLKAVIFGRGPDWERVKAEIDARGVGDFVSAPGFVETSELEDAMSRAICLVHPSSREGYGLVVVETAARGTPVVLVAGADNAATELVEPGVNGFVSPEASAHGLAEAIIQVHRAGDGLRASTAAWFIRNRERLSMSNSIERVVSSYTS